jgi:anti-sigma B factor antagonist
MLSWHHDDRPEPPGRHSSPTAIRRDVRPGWAIASGALDLSFRHRVRAVLDAVLADRQDDGRGDVYLDLSAVWLIDGSTVGVLAECHQRAVEAGGQLVLVGATGMVRTVLEITGIAMLVREPGELDAVSEPLMDEDRATKDR